MIAGAKMKERQFREIYSDTAKGWLFIQQNYFQICIQQNFRVSTLNICENLYFNIYCQPKVLNI